MAGQVWESSMDENVETVRFTVEVKFHNRHDGAYDFGATIEDALTNEPGVLSYRIEDVTRNDPAEITKSNPTRTRSPRARSRGKL